MQPWCHAPGQRSRAPCASCRLSGRRSACPSGAARPPRPCEPGAEVKQRHRIGRKRRLHHSPRRSLLATSGAPRCVARCHAMLCLLRTLSPPGFRLDWVHDSDHPHQRALHRHQHASAAAVLQAEDSRAGGANRPPCSAERAIRGRCSRARALAKRTHCTWRRSRHTQGCCSTAGGAGRGAPPGHSCKLLLRAAQALQPLPSAACCPPSPALPKATPPLPPRLLPPPPLPSATPAATLVRLLLPLPVPVPVPPHRVLLLLPPPRLLSG